MASAYFTHEQYIKPVPIFTRSFIYNHLYLCTQTIVGILDISSCLGATCKPWNQISEDDSWIHFHSLLG